MGTPQHWAYDSNPPRSQEEMGPPWLGLGGKLWVIDQTMWVLQRISSFIADQVACNKSISA